jgi:uncharacterized membrane protein YqjE
MTSATRTVREGVVVGLIAYVAVAAFYALFDFLAARGTLYTLDLLGKAVFRGLRDPAVLMLPAHPDRVAMAWYNALHLAISLAVGLVVTSLVAQAELKPTRARLMGLVIVAGFCVTILAVGAMSDAIRPVLPWWSIVVANGLAVLLAGTYLIRHHPGTWRRLIPFIG